MRSFLLTVLVFTAACNGGSSTCEEEVFVDIHDEPAPYDPAAIEDTPSAWFTEAGAQGFGRPEVCRPTRRLLGGTV